MIALNQTFTAFLATFSLRNSGSCKTWFRNLDAIPDSVDLHCFAAKELMCPPCLRRAILDQIGHTTSRFFRVGGPKSLAAQNSTCQCVSAQGVQSKMTARAKSQTDFGPTKPAWPLKRTSAPRSPMIAQSPLMPGQHCRYTSAECSVYCDAGHPQDGMFRDHQKQRLRP